jgi:hypothetical protein
VKLGAYDEDAFDWHLEEIYNFFSFDVFVGEIEFE